MKYLYIILFAQLTFGQITLTVSGTTYNIISDTQFDVGTSTAYAEGIEFCASTSSGIALPIVYPDMRYQSEHFRGPVFNFHGHLIHATYQWVDRNRVIHYSSSSDTFIPVIGDYYYNGFGMYRFPENGGEAFDVNSEYPWRSFDRDGLPDIRFQFLDGFFLDTPTPEAGNFLLSVRPEDVSLVQSSSDVPFQIGTTVIASTQTGSGRQRGTVQGFFRVVRSHGNNIWELSLLYSSEYLNLSFNVPAYLFYTYQVNFIDPRP